MGNVYGAEIGRCPKCNAIIGEKYPNTKCDLCGTDLPPSVLLRLGKSLGVHLPDNTTMLRIELDKKYRALRTIHVVYRVLAYVSAFFGALFVIGLLFKVELLEALLALLGTAVLFVTLLAIADSIIVFVDIEHSSRTTAAILDELLRKAEKLEQKAQST